jgi:hypothetical protein
MTCIALFLAGQITLESSQTRVLLPNGSAFFLENRKSPYTSVQLILSSKGIENEADQRGYRHLLEHLVARSLPGHDETVEEAGGLLSAYTDRDWVRFEWKIPVGKEKIALEGLESFLRPKSFTAGQIKKESRIIYLEGLETSLTERNIEKDWLSTFGSEGISTMGEASELEAVEPETLSELWKLLTQGPQVTVSISGDIDLKEFSSNLRKTLQRQSIAKEKGWSLRKIFDTASARSPRSLITTSIESKRTMSALIAAFGVGAKLRGATIHYQPSFRGGILTLEGEGDTAQVIQYEGEQTLFELGKRYAKGWIKYKTSNASESAAFHGILMSLDRSFSPRKLMENVDLAPISDFRAELMTLQGNR